VSRRRTEFFFLDAAGAPFAVLLVHLGALFAVDPRYVAPRCLTLPRLHLFLSCVTFKLLVSVAASRLRLLLFPLFCVCFSSICCLSCRGAAKFSVYVERFTRASHLVWRTPEILLRASVTLTADRPVGASTGGLYTTEPDSAGARARTHPPLPVCLALATPYCGFCPQREAFQRKRTSSASSFLRLGHLAPARRCQHRLLPAHGAHTLVHLFPHWVLVLFPCRAFFSDAARGKVSHGGRASDTSPQRRRLRPARVPATATRPFAQPRLAPLVCDLQLPAANWHPVMSHISPLSFVSF
jgi:hypothetical protein